ncbi:MAG: bifunctional hydroxymethylpyrimidine kinase/phosphomethylpyrimidine kinase [Rickettsiales bacterium]|jgi:hydroxymethylpyrimidine/phosphomethylpyrimidine kinase|nr:bifunctional hydroxymethylpyrimidine kinase/phosphomethylpyrimidine kinase [Rickettsiales bacterium]
MKKCLTIAGSDCSGGAGIQADLKTFSAIGVYGMSVITSVVAENTSRVISIQNVDVDIINDQIDAVFEDIEVDGLKIGMLSSIKIMEIVAKKLLQYKPQNIVIDPVMYAKGGSALMGEDCINTLIKKIIPFATLLTPNIPEAEKISGKKIDDIKTMEEVAKIIHEMGCKNVLMKGGHLKDDATDILYDGNEFYYYKQEKINTKNTHGTGCTLSSAIASYLALEFPINVAVTKSKEYITGAIKNSLPIGKGYGPTNHFWRWYV